MGALDASQYLSEDYLMKVGTVAAPQLCIPQLKCPVSLNKSNIAVGCSFSTSEHNSATYQLTFEFNSDTSAFVQVTLERPETDDLLVVSKWESKAGRDMKALVSLGE